MTKQELLDENNRLRRMYFQCAKERNRYYMMTKALVEFLETLDDKNATELVKQADSIIFDSVKR